MLKTKPKKIMLVAAETSGDRLGAELFTAIQARAPRIQFCGVGGPQMAAKGIHSPFDISELSVLGFIEGICAYPTVKRRVADVIDFAETEQPDMAVLIDSWGFTLRVAQGLKQRWPDMPVIKYVAPQVWASRPGRAKTLAKTVDHLLSIMTFDEPYFNAVGLPTTFVGNPHLFHDTGGADPAAFRSKYGLSKEQNVLLVLPGSRQSEITRLHSIFTSTAQALMGQHQNLAVIIMPGGNNLLSEAEILRSGNWARPPVIVTDQADKFSAFGAATCALACSGSVTTELALMNCPMVVGYKLGALSHFLIKRVITIKWATMLNIAMDREVIPEFIQGECTHDNLVPILDQLLSDPGLREQQRQDMNIALDKMGRGQTENPADKAAEVVLSYLQKKPT